MPSFNKVILLGNITRDPELRSLSNSTTVVNFSIAVNRTYTKDGEKHEDTMFVDVEAFGRPAETISKYCKKGSGILIEGRLRIDKWGDKTAGTQRSRPVVTIENFTFVGGNQSRGNVSEVQDSSESTNYVPPTRTSYSRPTPPPADDKPSSTNMDDQDVPF